MAGLRKRWKMKRPMTTAAWSSVTPGKRFWMNRGQKDVSPEDLSIWTLHIDALTRSESSSSLAIHRMLYGILLVEDVIDFTSFSEKPRIACRPMRSGRKHKKERQSSASYTVCLAGCRRERQLTVDVFGPRLRVPEGVDHGHVLRVRPLDTLASLLLGSEGLEELRSRTRERARAIVSTGHETTVWKRERH